MIISTDLVPETVENTFTHKERNQFNFRQTTVDNQNYPETVHKIQAINLINKLPNIIKTENRPIINGLRIILAKCQLKEE